MLYNELEDSDPFNGIFPEKPPKEPHELDESNELDSEESEEANSDRTFAGVLANFLRKIVIQMNRKEDEPKKKDEDETAESDEQKVVEKNHFLVPFLCMDTEASETDWSSIEFTIDLLQNVNQSYSVGENDKKIPRDFLEDDDDDFNATDSDNLYFSGKIQEPDYNIGKIEKRIFCAKRSVDFTCFKPYKVDRNTFQQKHWKVPKKFKVKFVVFCDLLF